MNKHCFKVIFNKSRGLMMAVAENTITKKGKSPRSNLPVLLSGVVETTTTYLSGLLKILASAALFWIVLIGQSLSVNATTVIADPNAGNNQRPIIVQSANGTAQVNIQTPTAGGISVNQYQQFDVSPKGVILNNSRTNAQTQIGGWVQGNTALAGGEARAIVNQVNSNNPSVINGYVEVAGRRADVIIANPSGINVDGGGFINANAATLTTGKPIINNGQLTGFDVKGGVINVTGQGLDSSKTNYTRLLSEVSDIQAGLWANDLTVVAGQNTLDANGNVVKSQASTNAPQVGIDTGHLGGMYAGKITLISTDKGVGINNAGQLFAAAGSFSISADGKVENTGAMVAQNNAQPTQATLNVSAKTLNNQGSISSQGKQTLHTEDLKNTGLIASANELIIENQQHLHNQKGTINAARIDIASKTLHNEQGKIVQTGTQALAIKAGDLKNTDKGLIGYTPVEAETGANAGGTDGTTQPDKTTTPPSTGTGNGTVVVDNTATLTQPVTLAKGRIDVERTLANEGGQITANGGVDLALTQGLDNTGSTLALNELSVNGVKLNNQAGTITTRTATINAQHIDNQQGVLQAEKTLTLTSQQLKNQKGKVLAGESATLNISEIDNSHQGALLSQADLTITSNGSVNNQTGQVLANKNISINANDFSGDGELKAGQNLQLSTQATFTADNDISAGQVLHIESAEGIIANAKLLAGSQATLTAQSIDISKDGEVTAANNVQLVADNLTNRGVVNSDGETYIKATQVTNQGTGRIFGDHVAIEANELINREEQLGTETKAAVIAARQLLNLGIKILTNREGALISSEGNLFIGGALDAKKLATGTATLVNNNSATIEAAGDLVIDAKVVRNTNEHFKTQLEEVARQHIVEYEANGRTERFLEGTQNQLGWRLHKNESWRLITPDGKEHKRWHRYNYDHITQQTKVIESAPGQIIAGGSLRIKGDELFNSDSQILSGSTLDVQVVNVNNHEILGQTVISDIGTITYVSRKKRIGKDTTKYKTDVYTQSPTVTDLNLGIFAYQEHTTIGLSNTSKPTAGTSSGAYPNLNIRTPAFNQSLPNNSLFAVNPNSKEYLIETDSRFTNYKKWLGSDYLFNMLGADTANMHKRLGDGYYEQRLINQQISSLTGRRYLDGFTNIEDQFKQLMDNGVTSAKEFNLTVGIALSPEQVARLTSDIVWLVEQDFTLADGRVEKVLVPQVYVRVQPNDINGAGTLLAGSSTSIETSSLVNSGTIAGREAVVIYSDNITNIAGRITGKALLITATGDINNISGAIDAKDQLFLTAGNNINVETNTYSSTNGQGKVTNLNRLAGVYVTDTEGKGTLALAAGNDINLKAADIANLAEQGVTSLEAKNAINIGSVEVSREQNNIANSNNYVKRASRTDVGSNINAINDIQLQAGTDLSLHASEVNSAKGNLIATAGQNINITAGQHYEKADDATKVKGKTGGGNSISNAYKDRLETTDSISSTLGAQKIVLDAGKNITVEGSNVIADRDTSIRAQNDINIKASANTNLESHFKSTKRSGVMAAGFGFMIGSEMQSIDQDTKRTRHTGSTVGGLHGSTTIIAGNSYSQIGSTVSAPNGDVNIQAKTINVTAADDSYITDYKHVYEQKGLTVAINVPIIEAIKEAIESVQKVGQSNNSRVNAMAAANAAWDSYKAGEMIQGLGKENGLKEQAQGISVSLTYGQQKNVSTSHTEGNIASPSYIHAGGKVSLIATGSDKDSNITITGSDVAGKNNTVLMADNKINILAHEQNHIERSQNKSSGFNAGIAASYANGTGSIGFTAGGNLGKGFGDGDETTYRYSHIGDKNSQTIIQSGGVTNIIGGQIYGKGIQITADELNIASLQDTAKFKGAQEKVSAQVTVGYGFSASGSYSKSKIKADYASVNNLSGVFAGDDGFNIDVNGNTNLVGALITSTSTAESLGNNSLNTGTLTAANIENRSEYKASGVSVGGNISMSIGGKQDTEDASQDKNWDWQRIDSSAKASSGFAGDSKKDKNITSSGVYTSNIVIHDTDHQKLITDKTASEAIYNIKSNITTELAENYHGLKNNFDKDKVQKEIDLQLEVSEKFQNIAYENLDKFIEDKQKDLRDQLKEVLRNPNSTEDEKLKARNDIYELQYQKIVAEVLIGALSGSVDSAIQKGALKTASTAMREESLKNSWQFTGARNKDDSDGYLLSNISFDADTFDGIKLGGARVVLDSLCGVNNKRCETDNNGNLNKDERGYIIYKGDKKYSTIQDFLNDPKNKEAAPLFGATGGLQGIRGTMAIFASAGYAVGSIWDHIVEGFAGAHDYLGGQLPGFYDKEGNATRGRDTQLKRIMPEVVTIIAIPISAPFAAAELISPKLWGILLK